MIGCIYRIIHLESDVQYVGSTFNEPRKRWQHHKEDYFKWQKGKHANVAIYPYMQQFGIDKFKLIPIKSYDVIDRKHLFAYEQLWMSKLKCVNKINSFYLKKLSMKQYREERRGELNNNAKQYREANKEIIKERQKQYRESNKATLYTTQPCECGGEYRLSGKARHLKTQKHQSWLQNNNV